MISTSCFLPVYRENKNREKTGQPKKELPRFFYPNMEGSHVIIAGTKVISRSVRISASK